MQGTRQYKKRKYTIAPNMHKDIINSKP